MTIEEKAIEYFDKNKPERKFFSEYKMIKMMENFARETAKSKLEEAAGKAKVKKMELGGWINLNKLPEHPYIVDKESITNTNLD